MISESKQNQTALLYLSVALITGLGQFFFIPFITNHLTIPEYGNLSIANATLAFVMIAANPGVLQAYTVLHFDASIEKKKLFWNFMYTYQITSIISAGVFILIYYLQPNLIHIPLVLFISVLFSAVIEVFFEYIRTRLRVQQKAYYYAILMIVRFFLTNIAFIYLLKIRFGGPEMKFFSLAIITVPFIVFYIFNDGLFQSIPRVSIQTIKQILRLALPVFPAFILDACSRSLDRIFISGILHTNESVGIYEMAMQITIPIMFLSTSLMEAFRPVYYHKLSTSQDNINVFLQVQRRQVIVLIMLSALFVSVFANEFIEILTKGKFKESILLIPIIAIGRVIQGAYLFYDSEHYYKRRSLFLGIVGTLTVIITCVINVLFLKKFGVLVAAISFTIGLSCYLILSWLKWKKNNSSHDYKLLVTIVLLAAISAMCMFNIHLAYRIVLFAVGSFSTMFLFKAELIHLVPIKIIEKLQRTKVN